jgi:hypothetical protein
MNKPTPRPSGRRDALLLAFLVCFLAFALTTLSSTSSWFQLGTFVLAAVLLLAWLREWDAR